MVEVSKFFGEVTAMHFCRFTQQDDQQPLLWWHYRNAHYGNKYHMPLIC